MQSHQLKKKRRNNGKHVQATNQINLPVGWPLHVNCKTTPVFPVSPDQSPYLPQLGASQVPYAAAPSLVQGAWHGGCRAHEIKWPPPQLWSGSGALGCNPRKNEPPGTPEFLALFLRESSSYWLSYAVRRKHRDPQLARCETFPELTLLHFCVDRNTKSPYL